MHAEREVVAAQGTTPEHHAWTLMYDPAEGQHRLRLLVNGSEQDAAWGFEVPEVTEIGFSGGLTPGSGNFYLYGLVTARIGIVRAECDRAGDSSMAKTAPLPSARADGMTVGLRSFVLVRPPIENVTALVGLDATGRIVQRVPLERRGRCS